jgi:hypothetical protein
LTSFDFWLKIFFSFLIGFGIFHSGKQRGDVMRFLFSGFLAEKAIKEMRMRRSECLLEQNKPFQAIPWLDRKDFFKEFLPEALAMGFMAVMVGKEEDDAVVFLYAVKTYLRRGKEVPYTILLEIRMVPREKIGQELEQNLRGLPTWRIL